MTEELLAQWSEYKNTERYKQALGGQQMASMGMGFLGSKDTFTDFMDWLVTSKGEQPNE